MRLILGVDTSCYTTSLALLSDKGEIIKNTRRMLPVELNRRGLRQSDALFLHIKNFISELDGFFYGENVESIAAVGVSCSPRAETDSYMPVFLVGTAVASAIAHAKNIPLFKFSHQQGHIRAAMMGSQISGDFIAFHVSGGTTELLHVKSDLSMKCLGGSLDINAGQLVDRIGVKLGFPFPSGSYMDKLASEYDGDKDLVVKSCVRGLTASFSGAETALLRAVDKGEPPSKIAFSLFDTLTRSLIKLAQNACEATSTNKLLFAGGVMESETLRSMLPSRCIARRLPLELHFARHGVSSDNAVGVALLALDSLNRAEH